MQSYTVTLSDNTTQVVHVLADNDPLSPLERCRLTVADEYATIVPYVAPPPPEVDLKYYTTQKRYALETGGITVGGAIISTDRGSQSLINGAFNYVNASGAPEVKFKAQGGFVILTAAQVQVIALAVGAWVQACFAAEMEVWEMIDAGVITTVAEVDLYAWPSN